MDVIVTYEGDGWNHLTVPSKGSLALYPDGLLNVIDSGGRTYDAKHNVKRVELMQEPWDDRGVDFTLDAPKPTP